MSTIPANEIVNVIPSVLAAGGAALDLNGLMLTTSIRPPIGSVLQFPDVGSVEDFFGPSSDEVTLATIYFEGYNGATESPGNLLFAQYPTSAVAAYVRGGDISDLSLAQLQALSGTMNVTVDGYLRAGGTVNLSGATSPSNAASIIKTALNTTPITQASFTGVISTTTLTASSVTGSPIAVGQTVVGAGVAAGTTIVSLGTGTGGAGTYIINNSQTVGSVAMTTQPTPVDVTYDSVSGAIVIASGITGTHSTVGFPSGTIVAGLELSSATGATLSQGSAIASPSSFMNSIIAQIQNWATFMLTFNPDVSGNTNRLAFAAWASSQSNRYAFVCSDDDTTPQTQNPATSSLGYLITQANYSGTYLIWESGFEKAAFACGIAASIDFETPNGRTTFAFRSQSGLTADITDASVAQNLIANGYNFYGAYATANAQFVFMQDGQVSGPFNWMDSYINEIWLNNSFQLSLMLLLSNVPSIPYNAAGNAQIESALSNDIQQALTFGAIRAGVAPSADQAIAVNAAAGLRISGILATRGWYLQVLTPSASVRQARGSPVCNFWYMDGESIQKITLSSVNVQ